MTKAERDAANGRRIELIEVNCYDVRMIAGELQLITSAGFYKRIVDLFKLNKIEFDYKNLWTPKNTKPYEPNWKAIESIQLREGQRPILEAYVKEERARFKLATGAGKSFLIPLMCKMFPKANIAVTTKHKAVLNDLYKNLKIHLPDVGIYHSGKKSVGHRVMCYSSGCLHHADTEKTHIIIADEVHELATDKMFEIFAQFKRSRMYGLSANQDDRFDGADFELEGIFGPLLVEMSYQQGVEAGSIVPIEVHWRNVIMDRNPAMNYEGVTKTRHGIWRNKHRNAQIAQDAREYKDDQVLIVVSTFEHACHLKQLLPEYTLVYAPSDKEADLEQYIKWKLIPADEPKMTADRLERLKVMFEKGKLKKVIATSVWNRGVNFKELSVLIRADAGSSKIVDTQVPGRLSRTTDKKDKHVGVLIDYLDQFDDGFKRKAGIRRSNYEQNGWSNIMPDPAGKFKQVMEA